MRCPLPSLFVSLFEVGKLFDSWGDSDEAIESYNEVRYSTDGTINDIDNFTLHSIIRS